MNLPNPPGAYDANDQAQTRNLLVQEDKRNLKRDSDMVIKENKLIIVSPDGTRWSVTIDNTGTMALTPL